MDNNGVITMAEKTDYRLSNRIAGLKPSLVREILKAASVPGTVAFAAGNPAPEAFPVEDVRRISSEIFADDPILALQYGVTEGYGPLIDELTKYAKSRYGIGTENDSLMVTSGAQQVMDLVTKVLCNEGDVVICEDPSFIGSLNCFRAYGAELVGVPLEDDGISVSALEDVLKNNSKAKFLYTIPNFQNPAGVTMSLEKRKAVYELASKYDIIILEDNPYGDLRVSGEDIPAIKTFDTEGRVIYAGTFSKVISPGIRVGYAIGPKALISKMVVGKQTSDVHTTMFSQLLVYRWLTECDVSAHMEKMHEIYRRKLELMCGLIDSELKDAVTYVKPQGGLFVWCKLRDDIDMMTFCQKAADRHVAVVPGIAFLTDETAKTQYIRLNFSTPSDDDIVKGMKILGEIAKEF